MDKPIVFDKDCPETTPERAIRFRIPGSLQGCPLPGYETLERAVSFAIGRDEHFIDVGMIKELI